jgi:hypothetical protein
MLQQESLLHLHLARRLAIHSSFSPLYDWGYFLILMGYGLISELARCLLRIGQNAAPAAG